MNFNELLYQCWYYVYTLSIPNRVLLLYYCYMLILQGHFLFNQFNLYISKTKLRSSKTFVSMNVIRKLYMST